MTCITGGFYDDKCYIEISGHACTEAGGGYGMPSDTGEGDPLACAAVSVLVMTALEKVKMLDSDGAFISSYVTVEPGYALFDLEIRAEYADELKHAIDTLMLGFELLEENYPDCVSVA